MAGSEKWVVRWLETLHFTGSRINVNKYILARKNRLERGQKSFFVFLICMISPGGRPHEIVGNALPKDFKIPWKRPMWSWLERFFWALIYHIKQIASITSQCPGKGISAQKKDSRKRRNSSLSVFYYNYSFKYTLRVHWQLKIVAFGPEQIMWEQIRDFSPLSEKTSISNFFISKYSTPTLPPWGRLFPAKLAFTWPYIQITGKTKTAHSVKQISDMYR